MQILLNITESVRHPSSELASKLNNWTWNNPNKTKKFSSVRSTSYLIYHM